MHRTCESLQGIWHEVDGEHASQRIIVDFTKRDSILVSSSCHSPPYYFLELMNFAVCEVHTGQILGKPTEHCFAIFFSIYVILKVDNMVLMVPLTK